MAFFGGGASVDLASPTAIGSTTPNTGAFTTLSATPPANTTAFTSSGYSITGSGSTNLLDITGTWNTTGTPRAINVNITNTASNFDARLIDLRVGGTSRFFVQVGGTVRVGGGYLEVPIGISNDAGGNTVSGITNGFVSMTNIAGIRWASGTNWLTSHDLFLVRDGGAGILAQRNSTNAQTFRLYRTYTDASNYERLGFIATRTTRFAIAAENAGTGAARSLEISFYTSASDPTSTDITDGCFSVWKNSGTGTIKLWANDGGTMKSVALA
jgi:hypothetical protein